MKWTYFCGGERIASVARDDTPKLGDPVMVVGRLGVPALTEHFTFVGFDEIARRAELERR